MPTNYIGIIQKCFRRSTLQTSYEGITQILKMLMLWEVIYGAV